MQLGRLTQVDLRTHWKHEARDFTTWLAKEENIELLSDAVGIGIQVEETEASVGHFNVDIYAQEENSDRKVIIENQLETTNHTHLGQLITYTAGLGASHVIWIVRDVREEHQQAIEWLNEHTDDEIGFFLVSIELWQIGDSPAAPKFQVLCRPNTWQRAIRGAARSGDLSETKLHQLKFWEQFKEYSVEHYPEIKLRIPRPRHWFQISIGRSDAHLTLVVDTIKNMARCGLTIRDSKELFHALHARKDEIETELGIPEDLEWREMPTSKSSRIFAIRPIRFEDQSTWPDAIAWLTERSLIFKRVFQKD